MNTLITFFALLAVVVCGVLFAVPVAHAQINNLGSDADYTGSGTQTAPAAAAPATAGTTGSAASAPSATSEASTPTTATQTAGNAATPATQTRGSGGTDGIAQSIGEDIDAGDFGCALSMDVFNAIVDCTAYMMFLGMKLTIHMAIIASGMLNWVLMELVVGMGQLMANIPGVMVAWQFLRDVTNIVLVFFTIFIGIATIMGIDRFGYKKMLFQVLLVALLVNFSSTFAKFVIDVSNYATVQTYSMLITASGREGDAACDKPLTDGDLESGNAFCITNGLAGVFWNKLDVLTLWNFKNGEVGPGNGWRFMQIFFVGSIMFLVMAFVFGSMAALFAVRFITLAFLIIVSPLALFMLITGVSQFGKQWFDRLLKQSFFAPAVMVMWWITYKIADGMQSRFAISGTMLNGAPTAEGGMDFVGIMLFYFLVMGMLLASLALAKAASAAGSSLAIKAGTAVTVGAAARAGRATVGRGGAALAQSKFANNLAANGNSFITRGIGRNLKRVGTATGSASFDARGLSKEAQKHLGEAKKGGHIAARDARIKADIQAANDAAAAAARPTLVESRRVQDEATARKRTTENAERMARNDTGIQKTAEEIVALEEAILNGEKKVRGKLSMNEKHELEENIKKWRAEIEKNSPERITSLKDNVSRANKKIESTQVMNEGEEKLLAAIQKWQDDVKQLDPKQDAEKIAALQKAIKDGNERVEGKISPKEKRELEENIKNWQQEIQQHDPQNSAKKIAAMENNIAFAEQKMKAEAMTAEEENIYASVQQWQRDIQSKEMELGKAHGKYDKSLQDVLDLEEAKQKQIDEQQALLTASAEALEHGKATSNLEMQAEAKKQHTAAEKNMHELEQEKATITERRSVLTENYVSKMKGNAIQKRLENLDGRNPVSKEAAKILKSMAAQNNRRVETVHVKIENMNNQHALETHSQFQQQMKDRSLAARNNAIGQRMRQGRMSDPTGHEAMEIFKQMAQQNTKASQVKAMLDAQEKMMREASEATAANDATNNNKQAA